MPIAAGAAAAPKTNLAASQPFITYQRYDEFGQYLWGNLTWQDGQGRIVWGPATAATGGGGTADANTEALWEHSGTVADNGGPRLAPAPFPAPDEFVSEPLPRTLYLDPMYTILLDLQIVDNAKNGDACTDASRQAYTDALHLDVELRKGSQFVGGGSGANMMVWSVSNAAKARPADIAGHSACHFAINPEVAVLEAGSELKLRVLHVRQSLLFTYAFGTGHASTIRIPYYSAEEIAYRFTGGAGGDGPIVGDDGADPPSTGKSAAGMTVAAALFLPLARRRLALVAVSLALTSALFAGCLAGPGGSAGKPSESLDGQIQQTLVKDDTGEVGTTFGTMYGEVYDDLHIPLEGVHVSIIGTSNFTSTDERGRFNFLGLPPNVYRLRFDIKDYTSFEVDVEVKAGFVSKPSVMLYLANPAERNMRPHVHDNWIGLGETKNVRNDVVAVKCDKLPTGCHLWGDFYIVPKETDTNTVLPGTSEIVVTLTHTNQPGNVLGLWVKHPTPFYNYNWSYYAPRASGEAIHIPTSWESTDAGHAPYSLWVFKWAVAVRDAPPVVESYQRQAPGVEVIPTTAARVDLRKGGVLPLEPKHPDDWKGAATLPILTNYAPGYAFCSTAIPGTPTETATCGRFTTSGLKKVPTMTRELQIKVEQTTLPTPAFTWQVRVKPASVPPSAANADTWTGYTLYQPTAINGLVSTFKIPVKEKETDFIYGKPTNTGWYVYVEASDRQAYAESSALMYGANYGVGAGGTTGVIPFNSLTISITAVKGDS